MTSLRLFICCYLSVLTCDVWAGIIQADGNVATDRSDPVVHKQEKLAGRANNVSNVSGTVNKNLNAQYPVYTQEMRGKKPMSKEEKRALRRQINETETMYPKKN